MLYKLADTDGINLILRGSGLLNGGSGLLGRSGSGLLGGGGGRRASAGGEREYHRQREKNGKRFFHGVWLLYIWQNCLSLMLCIIAL